MAPKFETAYAKINLALHVRKRRDDGYHALESLVAFLDYGDVLEAKWAAEDSFDIAGDYAELTGDIDNNLVVKAVQFAREYANVFGPLEIRLTKNLPVAAGLGGGSADAAAMLRILQYLGFPFGPSDYALTAKYLGADVPACLFSTPLIMRGIGEQIELVEDRSLASILAVLVNPNIAVPTGPVFKAWDAVDRGGLPAGTALEMALSGRNDLQEAAIALCPEIATILSVLNGTNPLVARMSGSGGTCFALYDNAENASKACAEIAILHPHWWVRAGNLTA